MPRRPACNELPTTRTLNGPVLATKPGCYKRACWLGRCHHDGHCDERQGYGFLIPSPPSDQGAPSPRVRHMFNPRGRREMGRCTTEPLLAVAVSMSPMRLSGWLEPLRSGLLLPRQTELVAGPGEAVEQDLVVRELLSRGVRRRNRLGFLTIRYFRPFDRASPARPTGWGTSAGGRSRRNSSLTMILLTMLIVGGMSTVSGAVIGLCVLTDAWRASENGKLQRSSCLPDHRGRNHLCCVVGL